MNRESVGLCELVSNYATPPPNQFALNKKWRSVLTSENSDQTASPVAKHFLRRLSHLSRKNLLSPIKQNESVEISEFSTQEHRDSFFSEICNLCLFIFLLIINMYCLNSLFV